MGFFFVEFLQSVLLVMNVAEIEILGLLNFLFKTNSNLQVDCLFSV